jgi:hypothetical protein
MKTEPTLTSEPSSAIAGQKQVLAERPKYHKKDQQWALVSRCWTKVCVGKEAKIRKSQQQAVVSHCWTRTCAGREAMMKTEPTLNSEPSSAIAGLGHVLPKKTRRPRYHKTKNPTPALVGQCTLKQVLVKKASKPQIQPRPATYSPRQPLLDSGMCRSRGREKKSAKAATSVPICFQRSRMGDTEERDFALRRLRDGCTTCVQLERSIPFIHTDTLVFASMGQIGHDCQEGCQAQAELN